ncbi:Cytochrome P450 monooxygenase astB [Cladobotryum mycophilum]|uniref:Cytochrome P450 monooxygenase astB n=1 Tax=Cladobotryum mycophilum TaxID=491253 RepID=A0ABR0T4I2_9HYPO
MSVSVFRRCQQLTPESSELASCNFTSFKIRDSGFTMAIQDYFADFHLTWGQTFGGLFALWLIYAITLTVQRLWLSPISHIPGPKLAALTQYYEFYYDIILGGQYTFKILEMHKKYGPVIRISPWEVHVGEHAFHSELYAAPNRPRNKWPFWAKQFGAPYSALATLDHHHHKLRRSALNPFFSTQTVRKLQPVVEERADALLEGFVNYASSPKCKEPLDFMYPYSAFTNDVINEYAFARSDRLVDASDFGAEVTDNLLLGTHMGPLIKHANWLLAIVMSLPESVSGFCIPGWGGWLKMKNDILSQIKEIKASENTEQWQLDVNYPTIFHELISSKLLPEQEKTPERLAQEGQILVQGGTLTTSWTLSLATFHLLNRPETLRKLRNELFAAIPDPNQIVPLTQLESLPYLRAVVKESLRHGIGTSGRLPRIAPDESFSIRDPATGKDCYIPPNTVISMSPYKTIMDPTLFPDPLDFRPERWLDSEERLDSYLTVFGGGPRVCLGQALVTAELYLMLAKFFRRWGSGGVVGGSDDGDRREGDVGCIKIYETTSRDCEMASDYFIPIPYKGSKGLRFVLALS